MMSKLRLDWFETLTLLAKYNTSVSLIRLNEVTLRKEPLLFQVGKKVVPIFEIPHTGEVMRESLDSEFPTDFLTRVRNHRHACALQL